MFQCHNLAAIVFRGERADALATFERRAALGRLRSRDPLALQGAVLRQALDAPEVSPAVLVKGPPDTAFILPCGGKAG